MTSSVNVFIIITSPTLSHIRVGHMEEQGRFPKPHVKNQSFLESLPYTRIHIKEEEELIYHPLHTYIHTYTFPLSGKNPGLEARCPAFLSRISN